jgi:hypothetical protein
VEAGSGGRTPATAVRGSDLTWIVAAPTVRAAVA